MAKASIEFKICCEKCGKPAPIDKDSSNENWIVFKIKDPCECGGRFVHKPINVSMVKEGK